MLIEIHMLKNYPPVNLNRDDSGAPKSCFFGGVQRGRISSQCLKRSWRTSDIFKNIGSCGIRTRKMPELVAERLLEMGVDPEIANVAKEKMTGIANKEGTTSKDGLTAQIVFYSTEEINRIAKRVKEAIDEDGDLLSVTEYQNGRIYDVYEKNEIRTNTLYYQYGNGDDYFTMVLREERTADPESHAEEVDSISVTVQNGLLVKTVNTGMYANWGGEEEKQWLRFSGTYTAEYDEDGIVSLSSAVHRVGPSGIDGRYTLTKENGVVTEAVCSVPSGDDWSDTARFTFEYTDIETTPARYARMINSFLMGSESSYYKYNWY